MNSKLTFRQLHVFAVYCAEDSPEAAAERLGVAVSTLKNTLSTIYRKLDVTNSRQAAWKLWGPGSKAA